MILLKRDCPIEFIIIRTEIMNFQRNFTITETQNRDKFAIHTGEFWSFEIKEMLALKCLKKLYTQKLELMCDIVNGILTASINLGDLGNLLIICENSHHQLVLLLFQDQFNFR